MPKPDYSIEEARAQAIRAGGYFSKVLGREGEDFLAARVGGVAIVVAVGSWADVLERAVKEHFGPKVVFQQPPPDGVGGGGAGLAATTPPPSADPVQPPDPVAEVLASEIKLIARYHVPKSQVYPGSRGAAKGHVHLHVLEPMKLKRIVRNTGECLCSKKHGSDERAPDSADTTMCPACVKVAEANGLAWAL